MNYHVNVSAAAEQDVDEAMDWYEGQKEGLGVDFLMKFYDAAAFLKENPRLYPEIHQSFRRVIMKKYPYAIYYSIAEAEKQVIVFAVWHMRQNPAKLKDRLK